MSAIGPGLGPQELLDPRAQEPPAPAQATSRELALPGEEIHRRNRHMQEVCDLGCRHDLIPRERGKPIRMRDAGGDGVDRG